MLIAFNKPFEVLSQFTREHPGQHTLAEFGFPKNVYPIGRLDADSEGLLLLSDEPELNEQLLHPRHAHEREYWAQVERNPSAEALRKLSGGIAIQGRNTLPCRAWILEPQPRVSGENPSPGCATLSPSEGERDGVRGPLQQPLSPDIQRSVKLPPRDPPIRFRKTVPTCWIGLELIEGKNRQVRRMTAAIGHPTLRLVRVRIGGLRLEYLPDGKWKVLSQEERAAIQTE